MVTISLRGRPKGEGSALSSSDEPNPMPAETTRPQPIVPVPNDVQFVKIFNRVGT